MVPPGTFTFSNRATTKTITATKTTKTTRKTMVPPGLTAVMVDSELVLTLTFSNRAICDVLLLARALRVELAWCRV